MAVNTVPAGTNHVPLICSSMLDAAGIVKKNLYIDREPVDLSNQLNVTSMYAGVCSGLKEDDYPLIEGLQIPFITDIRRVPLPPELVEQFGHMQCNCIMGVFPEIGRAWLTVDSDIFIWRYADGDDLAYFDGLAETILSVSLVQPLTGIFREHIKYLLVLTTPLDIVILGVSFAEDDVNNEMHLLPDPLFSISSDNAYLLHSVGTQTGRIFTGGKDGCLYEIVYQAKRGWFSRSCVKVNHSRSRLSFLLPSVVSLWLNEEDSICQICVDDTRNILYTRSEKGTISVYDLGEDGLSTSCAAQLRLDSIQRKARDIASGMEPSNLNEIIHISPITRHESRHMHLVAVTQAGVRLYFMTFQLNTPGAAINTPNANLSKLRPSGIYLVHVRFPPGFTSHSLQRPGAVHAAHYNAGTLLLSASSGDDGVLWCVSKDTYPFNRLLKETHSNFALDGRAWAISEVASTYSEEVAAVLPFGSLASIPPDPAMQVIQHIQKPSEYVVITSQGCHMFSRLRPVDQLRYLLENVADSECQAVEAFFKLYDNGEAACCCIILAMSDVPTDRHVGERAVAALVHYGGLSPRPYLAQLLHAPSVQPGRPQPAGLMSPIHQAQQQHFPHSSVMRTPGGLPVISTPMPGHHPPMSVTQIPYPGTPTAVRPAISAATTSALGMSGTTLANQVNAPFSYYSERQQGAFKMFARITRPLWEGRLVEDLLVEEAGKQRIFVVSRVDVDVVSSVLDQVNSLKAFVGKHCLTQVQLRDLAYSSRDYDVIGRPSFLSQTAPAQPREQQRAYLAEIARAELTSMKWLHELLLRSSEVLALWRILLHHQIHVLFEALDQPSRTTLKTIIFQDLVLSGDAICTSLVSTLINQFMDDNVTIDALNSQLREVCPSIYSADDATYSKASELLHVARKSSTALREENLRRAAQLFQQIAGSVNIGAAIQQFQAVRSYTEAVELCMKAAQAKDQNGLALKLYQSGLSVNDSQVDPLIRKAYLARMECYKYITDMLDELTAIAECPPMPPSVPLGPGPPKPAPESTSVDGSPMTPEEAQSIVDDCLHLAIQSNDELLHVTIYTWLLRKGLAGQLLQVSSPFIESFLRRVAEQRDETPAPVHSGVDLLWQHHERSGQHLMAAQVLLTLAEKPGPDRDLSKRIEYLSRAKVNAKSITSALADSATGGAILHEIEEKIEVAEIQMETLAHLRETNEIETINRLNSNLYDVSALYTEFADPYQLAECKLAISHCSGVNDESLIKALWQNIIEDEIRKCDPAAESTVAATVKNKVLQLGRRYLSTRRYFPIDYIIVFLEKIACSRRWDLDWVFTTLLEIGVSITDVLDVYIKTHAHKLPIWSTYSKPNHLLWVQNEVIQVFLEDPDKYIPSMPNQRRFVNYLLDALAINLVQLRSITSPGDDVIELISHLRLRQAALEAMQGPRA